VSFVSFFGRFFLGFMCRDRVAHFGAFRFGLFTRFTGLFFAFLLGFFECLAVFLQFFDRPFAAFFAHLVDQFPHLFGRRLARVDSRSHPGAAAEQQRAQQAAEGEQRTAGAERAHEVFSARRR
jgi:hypothetical protein